ncbi:WWE domain [Trinorchestia longiramus]|nr:WWE domain [Trinorchestia longiramus]
MASSVWKKLPKSGTPAPNICINFLNNQCPNNKGTCLGVHTKYPFLWQMEVREKWHNFPEFHNKELELEYRVASSDGVQLSGVDPVSGEKHFDQNERWYADFDKMTLKGDEKRFKIRHLTTESRVLNNDGFSTKYEWFFKDEKSRWILYGQSVGQPKQSKKKGGISLQTTSSSDDIEYQVAVNNLKVWSIQSAYNKYELNFVNMTQTNQQTNVTRAIRRRPVAATNISGSGSPSDYTTSPMSDDCAVKKYKWQFLDESNKWIDYGSVSCRNDPSCVVTTTSSDIEKEFAKNPQGNFRIQSARNQYTVDFSSMTQTNLTTNVTRNIQRVFYADCSLMKKFSALSFFGDEDRDEGEFADDGHEWFFLDENNQWVKYGQMSSGKDQRCIPTHGSDDIEKHFLTKSGEIMTIKSSQHTYELNFTTMIQTNLNTRVQRPMCRMAKGWNGGGGNLGETALSLQVAYEWYFKEDDGSWVKHGSGTASKCTVSFSDIEKHFNLNPKTNLTFNVNGSPYVMNFTNMTQTNVNTGKVNEIYRRKQLVSMSAASNPSSTTQNMFTRVPSGKKVFTRLLKPSDGEYTKCLQHVRKSNPNCIPQNIYKIHNPHLKTAFENKKTFMEGMYPNVAYKDELLFHGTKPANVQAILEENIDWRLHGTSTGQTVGRGAYFSNSAQLSLGYRKALFVCRVLIGLFTTGNSSTVRPAKNANNQPYDTTVNQPNNPSIFVKYDTAEYYPEYYLEC